MQLTVIAVSSNTNSFGLRSVIFAGPAREAWEGLANYLNAPTVGAVLSVPEGQDVVTFLTRRSLECVRRLPDLPKATTRRKRTKSHNCPECGRKFDLTNETDADEWYHGHDCEPVA